MSKEKKPILKEKPSFDTKTTEKPIVLTHSNEIQKEIDRSQGSA